MRRPFTLGKCHLAHKLMRILWELQCLITSGGILINALSQYWKISMERKGCVSSALSFRIQSLFPILSKQNQISEFFWGHIDLVRA